MFGGDEVSSEHSHKGRLGSTKKEKKKFQGKRKRASKQKVTNTAVEEVKKAPEQTPDFYDKLKGKGAGLRIEFNRNKMAVLSQAAPLANVSPSMQADGGATKIPGFLDASPINPMDDQQPYFGYSAAPTPCNSSYRENITVSSDITVYAICSFIRWLIKRSICISRIVSIQTKRERNVLFALAIM